MGKYTIGLDYGTLSVRALLLDIESGEEIATDVFEYPHRVMETQLPTGKRLPTGWALQHPLDYLKGLETVVKEVLRKGKIQPEDVLGIGVDFTASTVLPVKADQTPLCCLPEFENEPHAYVKLWKHHGAEEDTITINKIAEERGEKWLPLYGAKLSSEWMIPKLLETMRFAPEVYQKADRFMEALDWIIWTLTGKETRSACGAGYKACYHHQAGYPSKNFFKALHPMLENVVEEKLSAPIKAVGETAGYLTESMAKTLGLLPGTPVATGIIDAHAAVLGSGIHQPETMMIIVGTSACHLILSETEVGIKGVSGVVKDGILPGFFAYEAGQCCVGDHFAWFTHHCVPERYEAEARQQGISIHELLVDKLKDHKAGQSGLLALDWFNGVRSPLMDHHLNGMILGMNLQTKPEEIYLALIEATAYGTRMIIELFEHAGVRVDSIVLGGGIPLKNKMLVQVYADICNRTIRISGSRNASARGAAILGAVAAPSEISGFSTAQNAVEQLGKRSEELYRPHPDNATIYNKLYEEYKTLHQYFSNGTNNVMKRLHSIRRMQNRNDY